METSRLLVDRIRTGEKHPDELFKGFLVQLIRNINNNRRELNFPERDRRDVARSQARNQVVQELLGDAKAWLHKRDKPTT